MIPTDQSALHALGSDRHEFASLTGTHPSTVRGWGCPRGRQGVQPTPDWVGLLLDAWTRCPEALEAARQTLIDHVAAE